ncbi:hypothetical protein BKA80DRAFT_261366 [Phyllosticta citrichinensis]
MQRRTHGSHNALPPPQHEHPPIQNISQIRLCERRLRAVQLSLFLKISLVVLRTVSLILENSLRLFLPRCSLALQLFAIFAVALSHHHVVERLHVPWPDPNCFHGGPDVSRTHSITAGGETWCSGYTRHVFYALCSLGLR